MKTVKDRLVKNFLERINLKLFLFFSILDVLYLIIEICFLIFPAQKFYSDESNSSTTKVFHPSYKIKKIESLI